MQIQETTDPHPLGWHSVRVGQPFKVEDVEGEIIEGVASRIIFGQSWSITNIIDEHGRNLEIPAGSEVYYSTIFCEDGDPMGCCARLATGHTFRAGYNVRPRFS